MSAIKPLVTVIIPCRNEAPRIRECLESIAANEYPRDRLEVLVVDGQSGDGTRAIVAEFAGRDPRVQLLDNPRKITPAALNVGLARARGQIIIRMDAHNGYPPNYIPALVNWLETSGADNVGGVWVTRPGADTAVAQAIAVALSHPLGVGNAHYRIGAAAPRWVDTVPFGCYRRSVFERIGGFDEELVRNQDDEFNCRLIRSGGRILLVPEIVSSYYARDSLAKVGRMFYQYGYFKPLVLRKIGRVMTVRQLIPALFVAVLAIGAVAAPWIAPVRLLWALVILAYAAAILACSLAAMFRHGIACGLALPLTFPVLHVSYGLGFLQGLLEFLVLRRNPSANTACIPLSR